MHVTQRASARYMESKRKGVIVVFHHRNTQMCVQVSLRVCCQLMLLLTRCLSQEIIQVKYINTKKY